MTMRRAGLPAVIALLAVLGMGRIAYTHFFAETGALRSNAPPPIDRRYALARAALPARGSIAYLSDLSLESEAGAKRHAEALYALAPLQLVPDDGMMAIILVDTSGPGALRELAARSRLRPAPSGPEGVAVARRGGP